MMDMQYLQQLIVLKHYKNKKKDYTRIVAVIEGGEECGSPDLRYYRNVKR